MKNQLLPLLLMQPAPFPHGGTWVFRLTLFSVTAVDSYSDGVMTNISVKLVLPVYILKVAIIKTMFWPFAISNFWQRIDSYGN